MSTSKCNETKIDRLNWSRYIFKWPFKKILRSKENCQSKATDDSASHMKCPLAEPVQVPLNSIGNHDFNLDNNDLNYAFGHSNLILFDYTWTIENFSQYFDDHIDGDPLLNSTKFTAPLNNAKFFMVLYPKGYSEAYRNDLSVYLELSECDQPEMDVIFKFSLLDKEGDKKYTRGYQRKFITGQRGYGWHQYITRAELTNLSLLQNDNLIVHCEIKMIKSETITRENYWSSVSWDENKDYSDLWLLSLSNEKLFDVELIVNDTKFLAHKVVLAEHSPVFAAMFEHQMIENITNSVQLSEIDQDAFEELLKYLYFGKLSSMDGPMAIKLLLVADKFMIGTLKSICEKFLSKYVNSKNVFELLLLSKLYDLHCLKNSVVKFFNQNSLNIIDKISYQTLLSICESFDKFQESQSELKDIDK